MKWTACLLVALSLCFGLGYLFEQWPLPREALVAVKGAGVGLLAVAAAARARSLDGWLLAALLALGSVGDILIELSLTAGGGAFAAAHMVSIALYRRNRRPDASPREQGFAALLAAATATTTLLLLLDRPEALPFTAYALLLGAMVATAWLSRFPRRLVGTGALLFLASDLLIVARIGLDARAPVFGVAIWYLYYFGQLLIFLGVRTALPPRERSSGGGG
jgi:uncharacterized membrane protein YhhN